MYEQDYDEKCVGGLNGYGGGGGYAGQIFPYVKNTQVFLCPDDNSVRPTFRHSSLALNANTSKQSPLCPLKNYACCDIVADSVSIATYGSPAKSVLLFEVVNSTDYNIDTEILPASQGGTASYCGGSPAGIGTGNNYNPNGLQRTSGSRNLQ